ncbi:MAG: FkbM family methyltransferase, partial [Campylobacterales bacterium]|nr:FkbM family methyltransferase [Campylobacterales bacterium]
MFTKNSFFKNKLRSLSIRLFNKLENNGDADFNSNGEKYFLDSLTTQFSYAKGGGRVIFDIGANVGDYSLMLSSILTKKNIDYEIHLFEPTQSCFKNIQEKFNDIHNAHLNNFGASDQAGEATIFYDKEQSGLASLYQRNLDSYNLSMNQSELIA